MRRKRYLQVFLVLQICALFSDSAAFAETYPVIKQANAFIQSIVSEQRVNGTITWIAPSHLETNPITGYQIKFFSSLSGSLATYDGLDCQIDVANARCSLTGIIRLNAGSQNQCIETNRSQLNRLYVVRIQALSNGALLGTQGESTINICDPAQIKDVTSVKPTPTSSPVPTNIPQPSPTLKPQPSTSTGPQRSEKTTNLSDNKNVETASPKATDLTPTSSDSGTSYTQDSPTNKKSWIKQFGDLGKDLDLDTRKRAQAVVISYLTVAIAVTTRQKG